MPTHRPAAPCRAIAILAALPLLGALLGCQPAADSPTPPPGQASNPTAGAAGAAQLAQDVLIVDTHVDVPYRLEEEWENVAESTAKGDFDYPRARKGGLDLPFLSIYTPASYQTDGGAKALADRLIDMVEKIAADAPDKFAMVSSTDQAYSVYATGRIGFALGMENGAPIEGDLENLRHFAARGVRYITLTHGKNNDISDSSYEKPDNRRWDGLSPFGEQVVAEMNRLGVMVDVSHVSDAAFWDVIKLTQAPVIASHSSCRHFTPDFERNMSDEMIAALAENGGVLQINFGSSFLTAAANQHSQAHHQAQKDYAEAHGLDEDSAEMKAWDAQYLAEHPFPFASVDDVVAHIDHVVQRVGVDHVGIGSDFDGVGDSLPTGLKSVADYPNLIAALAAKGYGDEDIEKICGGNLMRVWTRVEKVAAELQAAG